MFEKEAEEYFETECLHSYADTEEQLKEDVVPAFQKGAEFGYNKAKEWHKGSEHPNHNHEVLCILWGDTKKVGYCEHDIWHFEDFAADDEDVDYWKEIVLPKEIKENE